MHSEAVLDFLKDAVADAPDLPDDDGKPKRKRCASFLQENASCRTARDLRAIWTAFAACAAGLVGHRTT